MIAAALLVVLSVAVTGLTAIQFVQGQRFGGLIIAALLLWASVRATLAVTHLRQPAVTAD